MLKHSLLTVFLILNFIGSLDVSRLCAQDPEGGKHEMDRNFKSGTLTGDWNGLRTKLYEKGVDFEVEYFGDLFSLVSGGLDRRTDFTGLLGLALYLDANRLVGLEGAQFFIFGIGSHGNDFLENVGSAHDVSSIAAPDTFKLFELWYEQSF